MNHWCVRPVNLAAALYDRLRAFEEWVDIDVSISIESEQGRWEIEYSAAGYELGIIGSTKHSNIRVRDYVQGMLHAEQSLDLDNNTTTTEICEFALDIFKINVQEFCNGVEQIFKEENAAEAWEKQLMRNTGSI